MAKIQWTLKSDEFYLSLSLWILTTFPETQVHLKFNASLEQNHQNYKDIYMYMKIFVFLFL